MTMIKAKHDDKRITKPQICVICGNPYEGIGHNAAPLKAGRCCDKCNGLVVRKRIDDLLGRYP